MKILKHFKQHSTLLIKTLAALLSLALLWGLTGCAKSDLAGDMMEGNPELGMTNSAIKNDAAVPDGTPTGTPIFVENPFISTAEENVSTFSADVDTASYAYFRKLVNNGYTLPELMKTFGYAFRTEEFINYFKYENTSPAEGELFGVKSAIAPCPWNEEALLMQLTLQAETAIPTGGNNLVFLIDVSGSMASKDKLPLLKTAFSYLVAQLGEDDRVSIVTYSGKEAVVLSGCAGNKGETILKAIDKLEAGGSTNGQAGLEKAYEEAQKHMIAGGNNRIIMASDGDLNVGISSAEELKAYVEAKRELGIYLSILGFGTGNYRDTNMETLADHGNGVYYYIDGESEAERIFSDQLLSTLYTVAGDVKLQISFDPATIAQYRLIGYENRILNQEDFKDDSKDAGDVGAGHQVTVCYELIPTEAAKDTEDWMTLKVRYKPRGSADSVENPYTIGKSAQVESSEDLLFLTALIETAMILHNSPYLGEITLTQVSELLSGMDLSGDPARAEFRTLIQKLLQ